MMKNPIKFSELEEQTSFRLFGPTTKNKQLTLNKLVKELTDPVLSRIAEVNILASDKLGLVKNQISQFKISVESQQQVSSSPCLDIKAIEEGEGSNMPISSDQDSGGNPFQTAWEKWCNAKYGSSKKVPFDLANFEEHSSFSREIIEQHL
jgi:hypothetical protein